MADKMKTVDAQLNISVDVECPYCEESSIDLINGEMEGHHLNDEGEIINAALNGDRLGCSDLDVEVTCESCDKVFFVEGINW